VVNQEEAIVLAPDEGMLLLDLHVTEQGDVGVFIAAQQGLRLVQRVLAAFLPAAQDLDRGRLEYGLYQGGQRTDTSAGDDQPEGTPDRQGGPCLLHTGPLVFE